MLAVLQHRTGQTMKLVHLIVLSALASLAVAGLPKLNANKKPGAPKVPKGGFGNISRRMGSKLGGSPNKKPAFKPSAKGAPKGSLRWPRK